MQQLVSLLFLLFGVHLKSASTYTIFCEFKANSYHDTLYACYASSSDPCEENCTTVSKIQGDHDSGKDNEDVKAFIMENKQIARLPSNLASFFPNLSYVNFRKNLITNVSRNDILQYKNLNTLRLSDNQIVGIYEDIFEDLPLTRIEFDNNNIEYVVHNLTYVNTLGSIDFRNNKCIDMAAGSPENIDKLKDKLLLRCSHSPRVKKLEDDVFNIEKHDLESDDRISRLENTIRRLKKAMELKPY